MEYEIESDESVSRAVVRAVCAVEGQEPTALQPLCDVVDPDALDRLFEPHADGTPRAGGRVSLIVSGCQVTVDNGEYLTIRPLVTPRRAPADERSSPAERSRPDEVR